MCLYTTCNAQLHQQMQQQSLLLNNLQAQQCNSFAVRHPYISGFNPVVNHSVPPPVPAPWMHVVNPNGHHSNPLMYQPVSRVAPPQFTVPATCYQGLTIPPQQQVQQAQAYYPRRTAHHPIRRQQCNIQPTMSHQTYQPTRSQNLPPGTPVHEVPLSNITTECLPTECLPVHEVPLNNITTECLPTEAAEAAETPMVSKYTNNCTLYGLASEKASTIRSTQAPESLDVQLLNSSMERHYRFKPKKTNQCVIDKEPEPTRESSVFNRNTETIQSTSDIQDSVQSNTLNNKLKDQTHFLRIPSLTGKPPEHVVLEPVLTQVTRL